MCVNVCVSSQGGQRKESDSTFKVSLPTSVKAVRTTLQLRLPSQVDLSYGKLVLTPIVLH